jgi:hypothetical protein
MRVPAKYDGANETGNNTGSWLASSLATNGIDRFEWVSSSSLKSYVQMYPTLLYLLLSPTPLGKVSPHLNTSLITWTTTSISSALNLSSQSTTMFCRISTACGARL